MTAQNTLGSLIRATPKSAILDELTQRCEQLSQVLAGVVSDFQQGVTPGETLQLEARLDVELREFARSMLEWTLNTLEPQTVAELPKQVAHGERTYRRLAEKTRHRNILTRFGNITLIRATYRRGSRGQMIAPLEIALGVACGATPAAQDLVGRQVAAAGSSQSRVVEQIAERTGAKIGQEKLRNLTATLATDLEPQRELTQAQRLEELIDTTVSQGKNVVLGISRDGVSLGIAPFGNFEMASVATLTVYADGKRAGTVYLAAAPEENQATLSRNLTSLLKAIVSSRREKLSRIVYVTDAGKVETAYWKNVLRRLRVAGRPVKIHRVVDYYHVILRLTVIANWLRLTASPRTRWLQRVRKLMLQPGGWGRVLRSMQGMIKLHGTQHTATETETKALRYLRRYRRFMNYAEHRRLGGPIGSGVVESACKQLVTERLKLSGMRWSHVGAGEIMTLRSIVLSQTWRATFRNMLIARPAVSALNPRQAA